MSLYHYTDQSGFMGIFSNQELWASKIQYLNDENEYNLAFKLAGDYLKKLITETDDTELKWRLQSYLNGIPLIKDVNLCVCSLTENGDLLSQWRGYSKTLGGYSIGFNRFLLESLIHSQGFDLVKCIYEPKIQKKKISAMIDSLVSDFRSETAPDYKMRSYYKSSDVFLEKLGEIAPILKDASFSEEAEWRIIAKVKFEDLDFRSGKSMLTPYCKVILSDSEKENFRTLIDEVIVGHTPHLDLAVKATESFIVKHFPPLFGENYDSPIKVIKSSIPFRNW
ncbi:DUF2971 domain-containing protein [Serratia proteamaculans]|uniref:DUF2971 domain-containing protein n=1 Tax=Serratia proteamaculans TaxID=28151 RepID=UPI002178F82D|nr:DUF2971 domain-containing protein [Serratia proteamaculans]CAI0860442.1 Protein of uncharacterised function (DUF2971) [Serratia proteamaculans]CAI2078410.1 Protein of uncharacterised function (DUF2971) [Serratia proteamaculans]